ncbi:MAG: prenyltransferase [Oceanospirillaceae bacterium]|nr:prenyltransferase [Oceanospirillaceae bacterium]MCP5335318.1 prenyltransferase [Oceanospirillaceae bacterium]MCP5350729.1 prenyltransferase [Oceanospirillaceae bacterium]
MGELWLERGDAKTRQLLWDATYNEQGPWIAQELQASRLRFTLADKNTALPPLKVWGKAVRAISLTATATPALAVLAWLWQQEASINFTHALLALLGVLFLQMAVNLLNDVSDYLKLIDLPGSLGGSGVIQQGWRSAKQIRQGAYVCLGIGVLCGLPVVILHPQLWLIAATGTAGVLLYSAQHMGLKYRALGDIAVWLLCGPVLTAGISYAASGVCEADILWIGGFFGFTSCAILHSNNLNDIEADSQRGAITLAYLQGFTFARIWLVFYYVAAFCCLIPLVMQAPWITLVALCLPLLIPVLIKLLRAASADSPLLNQIRFETAKLHLLSGILLIAGILLS